jgi:hypothetical protein
LSGTAAAVVAALALAPRAQAACWWDGYGWHCNTTPPAYVVPYWGHDGYAPKYGYNYNDYTQMPNDYQHPVTISDRN